MRRIPFTIGTLPLALFAGGAWAQQPRTPAGDPPVIEVMGRAESSVAPDRATVTISVETRGPRAAEVAAENARIQARVLDTLRSLGFAGEAVSTVRYNVAPNWEIGPTGRRQDGYAARNAVRVRLTDLQRIGPVIDASLARGATGIGDVRFEASGSADARRRALAEATRNARLEAEAIASALGVTLGEILGVSTIVEPRGMFGGEVASSMRQAFQETQISPTDIVVPAVVVARWRLVRGR